MTVTWSKAFLAVPPSALSVDPTASSTSAKASREDMSRWMQNVPKIYSMLEHGTTDADFHRMVTSPISPEERQVGETYRHLFSTSVSAQPLRAEVYPDGRLTVVAGQHRVLEAQAANVPLIPVHVAAPDETTLTAVRSDLEARARAEHPAEVETQRLYDEHWRATRGNLPADHRIRDDRPPPARTER